MNKQVMLSLFLCFCLLLAGCGSAQAADASEAGEEPPFSVTLPEGTEIGECDGSDLYCTTWILKSDRWLELDLYPEKTVECPELLSAGWIRKSWGGYTCILSDGSPDYNMRPNNVEIYSYEQHDFGWLFTEVSEAYVNGFVAEYDIPQEANACSFWCAVIQDKSEEDTYYWLAFNQLCFTKQEAIEIAESFSLT